MNKGCGPKSNLKISTKIRKKTLTISTTDIHGWFSVIPTLATPIGLRV